MRVEGGEVGEAEWSRAVAGAEPAEPLATEATGEGPGKLAHPFRRDVHGLRGIAVVLVLCFHCRLPGFDAGFVGVDVFFVLSGFLISGQIWRMGERKEVRLGEFYARRLMRICPLLVVCSAVTAAAGAALLPLDDLAKLLECATAATLGLANVYFASTLKDGYFATNTRRLPLLHTWSVGAELQFYLLYPLLGLLRPALLQRSLGGLLFLGSLALFLVAGTGGGASYFLLHARLWQFLMGAASQAALRSSLPKALTNARFKETVMSISLLALIFVCPGFLHDKASSLLACTAASLVITFGSSDHYMWHWPVLSFASLLAAEATWRELVLLMVPVGLVSWLSKAGVEDLWRRRAVPLGQALLLCVLLPGLLLAGLWATAAYAPVSGRHTMRRGLTWLGPIPYSCWDPKNRAPRPILVREECRLGLKGPEPPEVMLLGDSHAMSMSGFVDVALKRLGKRGFVSPRPGVPFLLQTNFSTYGGGIVRRAERVVEYSEESHPRLLRDQLPQLPPKATAEEPAGRDAGGAGEGPQRHLPLPQPAELHHHRLPGLSLGLQRPTPLRLPQSPARQVPH